MDLFAQLLVNALALGAIYALAAVAYTLIYGILELINFAFGEMFMLAAFFTISLMLNDVELFGLTVSMPAFSFWIAAPLAIVAAGGVGWAIERIGYRPLRFAPRLAPLITAIAISVILQSFAQTIWGPQEIPFPRFALTAAPPLVIGNVYISVVQIFVVIVAAVSMLCLHLYVKKSRAGRAMRATAQDINTARLMGIPVNRVIAQAFIIGSMLAGIAGILYGAVYGFAHPTMGFLPGLKALVAAVLGGIGNIPGAMLGGIVLGFAETFGAGYIPNGSAYRDAIAFGILALLLVFRPQGLLGIKLPDHHSERGGLSLEARRTWLDRAVVRLSGAVSNVGIRNGGGFALAGLLLLACLAVGWQSDHWGRVMLYVFLYAGLASGLNVIVGFAGLLDLGYVAFWAVGSYFTSIIFVEVLVNAYGFDPAALWWLFFVNIVLGGAFAGLLAVLLGYPTLRLRGDYLAIMTLGFGEIVRIVITNWVGLTRGPMGIRGIPLPAIFGVEMTSIVALIALAAALVAAVVGIVALLTRSYVGRAWEAIREDETAANAMGIGTSRYKLLAYAVSGFFGGVMGVFYAHTQQFISPMSFTLFENIVLLMLVVLGGMGTLWGPLVGAAVWIIFLEASRQLAFIEANPEFRFLGLGVLLVILMIYRPQGLVPRVPKKVET